MTRAYAFIWAYQVRPDAADAFARAYAADGEWAVWYRQAKGYYGTRLLRDANDPNRFATIDYFASKAAREDYVADHKAEFDAIDARWDAVTLSEALIGEFWVELPREFTIAED